MDSSFVIGGGSSKKLGLERYDNDGLSRAVLDFVVNKLDEDLFRLFPPSLGVNKPAYSFMSSSRSEMLSLEVVSSSSEDVSVPMVLRDLIICGSSGIGLIYKTPSSMSDPGNREDAELTREYFRCLLEGVSGTCSDSDGSLSISPLAVCE